MASRIKLLALVSLLALVGGGVAAYKNVVLGIPLIVDERPSEWLVEAKVSFVAVGDPVTARLALPGVAIDRELGIDARSAGYSFIVEDTLDEYAALWASDSKEGPQSLYYRVRFPQRGVDSGGPRLEPGDVPVPGDPGLSGTLRSAAESVVRRAKELSSNPDTLLAGVFREITAIEGSQEIALLKRHYEEVSNSDALTLLGIDLLNMAGVPARQAYAVQLNEIRGSQKPSLFVEYFDGVYWKVRDPDQPASTLDPRELFVWNRGGDALLEVSGGENSQVAFTTTRDIIPMEKLTDLKDSGLLVSTIFGLPASERQVFRYVVLIPIGAFVVVILRNLIGIATLGTFMPVLLALALLEMDLKSGLTMFVVIVASGLWFRFLLSRLNLLVVPRVAACVVIVTLLMMLLSVVSWHLGMRDGLKITLFPMIILAWTIERMSLIWEEEGKRNALLQVAGSLVVAVIAYLFMELKQIRYWAFYFPELLLVLLAGIILVGRYTGYRLSELIRFKNFEEAV
ncbi:UUP1 family membrane protein [Haloferula sp. A504]|uniref:UUP1 family membrane protein n=1 Tax=Haloferula sp. A504 TaxID=3373601 RepID=UPI0031BC5338|nr:inactive transglutaminase family protein [Verrucomicrobiaceae bacterium E54]